MSTGNHKNFVASDFPVHIFAFGQGKWIIQVGSYETKWKGTKLDAERYAYSIAAGLRAKMDKEQN